MLKPVHCWTKILHMTQLSCAHWTHRVVGWYFLGRSSECDDQQNPPAKGWFMNFLGWITITSCWAKIFNHTYVKENMDIDARDISKDGYAHILLQGHIYDMHSRENVSTLLNRKGFKTHRHIIAGYRIIFDGTNICFHINVESASFLLGAPNFNLHNTQKQRTS